jgi:hypothetical protein
MITELVVLEKISDELLKEQEGTYIDESYYDYVITSDTDVYTINSLGEKQLILKFRKAVIPLEECKMALSVFKKPAMLKRDNRGASAGILDVNKLRGYVYMLGDVSKFRCKGYFNEDGDYINQNVSNEACSNILGYFDKPDRNIGKGAPPCRLTAFTKHNYDKWIKSIPYIKCVDRLFKELIPDKYQKQYDRAQETNFVIDDTSFSTITVNYNWRTALHKDAGDYKEGFGNLMVIEEGEYKGGYTGIPRYGVCVDVRTGDFLAFDVHQWHCNTAIEPITKDYTRLSVVCYLRERMLRCKGLSID